MHRLLALLLGFPAASAISLTPEDATARLQMARQIARERNDPALVARVETLGAEFAQGLPGNADERLRGAEQAVGIDPGGWSMAGQPLFHPTPAMAAQLDKLTGDLDAAMRSDDAKAVSAVTARMAQTLGDQAGVPDGRRAGTKPAPLPPTLNEAGATRLFLKALASEKKAIDQLSAGNVLPGQMTRLYADLLQATCSVRPFVKTHEPSRLPEIDALSAGLARILTGLQQPEGHLPFPDLRGANLRFGDMIQRQVTAGTVEVKDGWVITPDPDGGTQFDTGRAGVALLDAGQAYGNPEWTGAGLRAADWALGQPCVGNFNYNAFSVSLLSRAFQSTGQRKYLDGALHKFRVGIAPGQAANGRWLDAHNARSVYHVILLRGIADLLVALPAESQAERAEVSPIAERAISPLLDEFDAMGITVEALPELRLLHSLFPGNPRLGPAVDAMAGSIAAKCTDGIRVKMGSAPNQLAALLPR